MPYLYAVRMLIPNHDPQPIKIGYTANPDQRRLTYNSGPYPCEWLGVWVCYSQADELAFHMRFLHLNLTGEWFKPDTEFLSAVQEKLAAHARMTARVTAQAESVLRFQESEFRRAGEVLERTAGRESVSSGHFADT